MLKIVIIFIGVIELLIGIINSFIRNIKMKTNDDSKEKDVNLIKEKKVFSINELMALEGVTYIFLASVAINTNMNNIIVIILFMMIQVVFFLMLLKEMRRGNDGR